MVEPQSIRDAVHGDLKLSQAIYDHVDAVARRLGAEARLLSSASTCW